MARTMEVKVLTPTNVGSVGSSVRLYLHDANDEKRPIFAEMNPADAKKYAEQLLAVAEKAEARFLEVQRLDKIVLLQKVVGNLSLSEAIREAATIELAELEASPTV